MPFIDDKENEHAPKENHIAILMDDKGSGFAFMPGNILFIVDKEHQAKVPLVLMKVSMKEMTFRCGCGRHGCTAVYTFRASRNGYHPRRDGD